MPVLFDPPYRERSQLNGFAGNALVRDSELRGEDCIPRALEDPAARLHLMAEDRVLLNIEASTILFGAEEAGALGLQPDSLVLLGAADGAPRLAGLVAGTPLPETIKAVDLRSLASQGIAGAADLGAIAQARSLLHWHANHRFCGRCGAGTEPRGGGVRRLCPACGAEHFPRVDPVAIMLAIDRDRCVLGRQARFPPGMYSALAGFIEPGETIEGAVRREIREEAGIEIGRVAYHSSQPWPFHSSLMIGAHAEAVTFELSPDGTELEDCRWFDREEVRLMLAGSHPDGLTAPAPFSIARRLLATFADAE